MGLARNTGVTAAASFVAGQAKKLSPVVDKAENKLEQTETYRTVAAGFAAAKETVGKIVTDIDTGLNDGQDAKGEYGKRAASYKGELSDFFKKAYGQKVRRAKYIPTKQQER